LVVHHAQNLELLTSQFLLDGYYEIIMENMASSHFQFSIYFPTIIASVAFSGFSPIGLITSVLWQTTRNSSNYKLILLWLNFRVWPQIKLCLCLGGNP
jgi:hypothetical protein